MHVVATAGHVDHGKSTLVRALTGSDPDRLLEEHRRGLSIELGFCWTSLPDVGEVAFVDVPGHERFISTMLAGVGPVPAVLFVVAADDPWMPQAAEHLAVLDALGVSQAVVAVTRCDLADPARAATRARAELRTTSLGDVEVVPVSARTGAGLGTLRQAVGGLLRRLPAVDVDGDVRLWVDRRFHLAGAGTVVTGTLPGGRIEVGDRLACHGRLVRVRSIQTLGRDVREAVGTARVALSLAGDVPDDLTRGSALVTPDAWLHTTAVDVRVRSPHAVPARPLLHIGAAAVAVRCRPLGAQFARLSLERPLPLRVGDRFLLRDPGSRAVWGAVVADPDPPRLTRRGAARDRARWLASADPPTLADELGRRGAVRRSLLKRLGYDVEGAAEVAVCVGDWLLDRAAVPALRRRLRDLVEEQVAAVPLDPGLSAAVAAGRLGLPTAELVSALVAPPLHLEHGRVVLEGGHNVLPAALTGALGLLTADLTDHPYAAPSADRLAELGLDHRALAAAAKAGRLLRLADGVVLMPGADLAAAERLARLAQPFTLSEARIELGSSRRVMLPLLAHLDGVGLTRRLPDDRREVRAAAQPTAVRHVPHTQGRE